ncbi:MAG: cytochrome c3 family protein [Deltaproteobacteria bacterium]
MKKIVVMLVIVAFAGSAFAAAPDSMVLKGPTKGDITFGHKKHEDGGLLKDCKACHAEAAGGKIGAMGKEKGHAGCLDCHRKTTGNPKVPTKCGECHKK